jgi:hypothetical protein
MNDLTNEQRMKAEEKAKRDHEAHVRWQGITITQLGHVVNLLLAFSAATLGWVVNLIVSGKIKAGCELRAASWILLVGIIVGIFTNFSRLEDFRHSARAARCRELKGRRDDLGESLSQKQQATISKYECSHYWAKCFSWVSWWAFWTQLLVFSLSYLMLLHALLALATG